MQNQASITIETDEFKFDMDDRAFYEKHIFSRYAPAFAKAAKLMRETIEVAEMQPKFSVQAALAANKEGVGENYTVYFKRDMPATALLSVGIQQTGDSSDDGEVYLSKENALAKFDEFVVKHHGMALVSQDGIDSVEFVSLAHKVRVFMRLIDERSCMIACAVDLDENEPSVTVSFDFEEPGALIVFTLYAR